MMNELADIVEELRDPSHAANVEIYFHTQCRQTPTGYVWLNSVVDADKFPWLHPDGTPTCADMVAVPDYTGSMDAAQTLVPTEPFPHIRAGAWWWSVDSLGCDGHVSYENRDAGIPEYSGSASTPAMALCAAALRARADMLSQSF